MNQPPNDITKDIVSKEEMTHLQSAHRALQDIPPFALISGQQAGPIIISAPHGGLIYPHDLYDMTEDSLRRFRSLEDIGTALIAQGLRAPTRTIITACVARGIIDLNRPAYALDPLLCEGDKTPLPHNDPYAPYVMAGYGVIPRLSGQREPLHHGMISQDSTDRLISQFHKPYHQKLATLLSSARPQGLLLDIHSMPETAAGKPLPDFIFGDDFGASLPDEYRVIIDEFMRQTPYSFGWNHPYAGGYITRNFGGRHSAYHALQIEINRRLYAGAKMRVSHEAMSRIQQMLDALISRIETAQIDLVAAQ